MDNSDHVETVVKMSNQKYKPDSYVKMEVDAEDYYRIKDKWMRRIITGLRMRGKADYLIYLIRLKKLGIFHYCDRRERKKNDRLRTVG